MSSRGKTILALDVIEIVILLGLVVATVLAFRQLAALRRGLEETREAHTLTQATVEEALNNRRDP